MSIDAVWSGLQSRLHPGVVIPNWTRDNGLIGDDFTVVEIRPSYVAVASPGAKGIQRIRAGEFEKVAPVWDQYVSGGLPRHEVRDMTRFSKYVISILRWANTEAAE